MVWFLTTVILVAAAFGVGVLVGRDMDKEPVREPREPKVKVKRRIYIIHR
jgi:hypothetical protein